MESPWRGGKKQQGYAQKSPECMDKVLRFLLSVTVMTLNVTSGDRSGINHSL